VPFNSEAKTSEVPLNVRSAASAVTGKSLELVTPVSQGFPDESGTTALAPSLALPPRSVEYTRAEPVALTLAAKASLPSPVLSNAPADVGKSSDPVPPERYAFPPASTKSPPALSKSWPPRNVEETSPDPAGFSLLRVTSNPPLALASKAPGVV